MYTLQLFNFYKQCWLCTTYIFKKKFFGDSFYIEKPILYPSMQYFPPKAHLSYQGLLKDTKKGQKTLPNGLDWLSYLAGSSKAIRQALIEFQRLSVAQFQAIFSAFCFLEKFLTCKLIFLEIRIIRKQCPKNAQHYEMHPNYSYFSRAATVSRKGHKFLAFGLEIAQSFLKTHTMQKFQNMNRGIHHGAQR